MRCDDGNNGGCDSRYGTCVPQNKNDPIRKSCDCIVGFELSPDGVTCRGGYYMWGYRGVQHDLG